jgi:glucose dehydrogenase
MKSPIYVINRKQPASFRIVGLMLTIPPLWLMLAAAEASAQAQTINAASNAAVAPSPADWTQFLRDNMQRWNPYETVLGVSNVGTLKVKFKSPVSTSQESSPAVVNGVAYISSTGGDIAAVNVSTGAKLWSTHIPNTGALSPAVEGGSSISAPVTGTYMHSMPVPARSCGVMLPPDFL